MVERLKDDHSIYDKAKEIHRLIKKCKEHSSPVVCVECDLKKACWGVDNG